jgi:hypothetical protein
MRKLFLAMLLMQCLQADAQANKYGLIPYRKGDKWGYSDAQKKIIIEPRFSEVNFFDGEIATAKLDSYYCVINKKGDIIYKHKNLMFIADDGSTFITWDNSYTHQMFDKQGRPVTKVYNDIRSFNKYGYAQVTTGYVKRGLIDKTFTEVMPTKYGSLEFFTPSLVKVYDESLKKYGLFNLKTRQQFATDYSMIYPPQENMMMVRQGDLYGFMDMGGRLIVPVKYQKEAPGSEKRGVSYNESTYVDFNLDGFYSGLAVVVENGKAGYIDKKGRTVIPFEFDQAYGFSGNCAWVRKGTKWGMINKQGKYVLQPVYTYPAIVTAKELEALDGFHEGLVPVATDSLFGYVDTTGKVVIPFTYERAESFFDGLAAVYVRSKVGFINRKGEMVIEPKFKWLEGVGIYNSKPFRDGYGIALNEDESWSLVNTKGKEMLPYHFTDSYLQIDENGIGNGVANGKRYVFNTKGDILYTFEKAPSVFQHTPELFYNYGEKCYINIKAKVKYCD